jgi:azurin
MKKVLVLVTVYAFLISCGGEKKADKQTKTVEIKNIEAVNLTISGDDAMKYNKSELKVKAGQKVTLTLTHTGKFNKDVMGHNFVLLKMGTDIPKFAEKAMEEKANGYIPSEGVIAHTGIVGGGEITTVTFIAPAKGTYDFICSFPGHYGMMKGKFIVE